MHFSKENMRQPSRVSQDPMYAAASITDDHNITKLARVMGKSEKTLAAKLNNDDPYDQHHLHLSEAIAITELTDDERILKAWAVSRGKMLVPMPVQSASDEELSDLLLSIQEAIGKMAEAIRTSRADGVITEAEYAQVNQRSIQTIEQIMQLDAEIKMMVREWGDEHG